MSAIATVKCPHCRKETPLAGNPYLISPTTLLEAGLLGRPVDGALGVFGAVDSHDDGACLDVLRHAV